MRSIKSIVVKPDTIFKISLIVSVITLLLDFSTTYFYFRHMQGFVEGNFFVRVAGMSLELVLLPISITLLSSYIIVYYANLRTENKLLEFLSFAYFIVEPFMSVGAVVHNFFYLSLNENMVLALRFGVCLICSIAFLGLLHKKKIVSFKQKVELDRK